MPGVSQALIRGNANWTPAACYCDLVRHGAAATLQIAIEGCCHGELDNIYKTLAYLEQKEGTKIDLLICCGDFQVFDREWGLLAAWCIAERQLLLEPWHLLSRTNQVESTSAAPAGGAQL